MMTIQRGYPLSDKVRKETLPGKVIFTDTETSEQPDGSLRLLLGCYEIWRVDENGMPDYCAEQGTYFDADRFYQIVKDNLDCRVLAHNWRFDASVLQIGKRENMLLYGYDIDVTGGIYPAGKSQYAPFLVRLQFEDGYADLLCNTNYYKMPLAVIGDSFGVDKLSMPDTADTARMIEYCQRDVEILRKAYFSLFAFTLDIADTTPGITAAMAANRVYRKRFYTRKRKVQGSQHIPYITNAERQAYHGGRTDTFYKGIPQADRVYKYDVNSLYPSCMVGSIPIRYIQTGNRDWANDICKTDGAGDNIIILAHVDLHIPPESDYAFIGLEGVKTDDKGLIFPVGRYTCWVWQPLLQIAFEQGYVERVNKVLLYDAEPLFDDYVSELFSRRSQYKAQGNTAYDVLTKLMLNSLYGKFAQRENDTWVSIAKDSNEYAVMAEWNDCGMRRFSGYYDDSETQYWQIGESLWAQRYKSEYNLSRAAVCSIAGYITAKARATLWRGLAAVLADGGTLYMTDTDSIITDIRLPDSMVSETEIGKYKLEQIANGTECDFRAPKHYQFGNKLAIKGIRAPEHIDGPHNQTVFPNFMTDMMSANPNRRARLDTGAVIRHIIKEPTGYNNKRVVIGDNRPTYPIVLGY